MTRAGHGHVRFALVVATANVHEPGRRSRAVT